MRSPRPTIRRLMLGVAVVAVLVWSTILAGRAFESRSWAVTHELVCRVLASEVVSLTQQAEAAKAAGASPAAWEAAVAERRKEWVEEKRIAALYWERTWRPWKSIRSR